MDEPAPGPPELPSPWQQHMDEASGSVFYYNPETEISQWEAPVLTPAVPAESGPAEQPAPLQEDVQEGAAVQPAPASFEENLGEAPGIAAGGNAAAWSAAEEAPALAAAAIAPETVVEEVPGIAAGGASPAWSAAEEAPAPAAAAIAPETVVEEVPTAASADSPPPSSRDGLAEEATSVAAEGPAAALFLGEETGAAAAAALEPAEPAAELPWSWFPREEPAAERPTGATQPTAPDEASEAAPAGSASEVWGEPATGPAPAVYRDEPTEALGEPATGPSLVFYHDEPREALGEPATEPSPVFTGPLPVLCHEEPGEASGEPATGHGLVFYRDQPREALGEPETAPALDEPRECSSPSTSCRSLVLPEPGEPSEATEDELPEPWQRHTDPASGQFYYHNRETNTTQWEVPLRAASPSLPVAAPAVVSTAPPSESPDEEAPSEGEPAPEPAVAAAVEPVCEPVGTSSPWEPAAVEPVCETVGTSSPWVPVKDVSTGRFYYYNKELDVTQWEATEATDEPAEDLPQIERPWVRYKDLPSGRYYYYNIETMATRWKAPGSQSSEAEEPENVAPASKTSEAEEPERPESVAPVQPSQGLACESEHQVVAWEGEPQILDAGDTVRPWENVEHYCDGGLQVSAARNAWCQDGVHQLLVPFMTRWQSLELGFVEVRRRPDAEVPVLELDVCVPSEGWEVLGRIHMDGKQPVLEAVNGISAKTFCLDGSRCKKWRVWWKGPGGSTDVWDLNLLEAAVEADAWVKNHGLIYDLGAALARLREPTMLSPQPSGTWISAPQHTVGLCVATMNRLWQLRMALPLNLLHCWPHRKYTRIHVVDFGSTDGTLDFLLKRCRAAIDAGLLVVYTTDQLSSWHASVAKNTAHMVATEDILVNLDGDNLVGADFPADVVRHFTDGKYCVQYEDGEGTCGRIAVARKDFHFLHGYDEECYPMGAQDVDLVLRIKSLRGLDRYKKVRRRAFSQAIHNSLEQKVENCMIAQRRLRWGQMDTVNRMLFQLRRDDGQLRRNEGATQIGVKCWKADLPTS